jgi:uncharacterized Zn finger protein
MKTIFPCWDKGIKSYELGGKVQCDVCGSFSGVKNRLYWNTKKNFTRCVSCGSVEVKHIHTGEILNQKVN